MPLTVADQCPVLRGRYLSVVDITDAMSGAVDLGDGLTPIDVWQGLHANARAWSDVPYAGSQSQDHILIDGTDLSVLKALENYSAKGWHALCTAAGMTVYGAVALSWCEGAELSQVWDGWEASGFPLKPSPEFERPARFINPTLLPQTNKLSGILEACNNKYQDEAIYNLAICATIASQKEPPEFDLPPENLTRAQPQIAAFLKSRTLKKPDRTAQDNTLIAQWDKTIAGSQWDIWEENR